MSNEHIDISKIRQGNEFAFVQFYRQYAQQAYLMSYKYLGNKDMAEDAVQELFVKLWEHRAELDDDESVGGFVFTMLKHLLLDTIRHRRKDMFIVEHNMEVLNLVAVDADVEEKEQADDIHNIFKRAFAMLSPKQQQIVRYKLTGKMSNTDIAECMGISVNTVKVQYYIGLKRLREQAADLAYVTLVATTTWNML